MSKLLVVFGATGQQGGSIANYVLDDLELSKQYKVRAVTRNPSNPAAQALHQRGAEVVKGDADNAESLKSVLNGAHTVFALTVSVYDDGDRYQEVVQGKAIADEALAAGAQYLIFSTLPHISKITDGKITTVEHFDIKAHIEAYIRTLPIKSAFYAPGYFMQNFDGTLSPRPVGDGTFALHNVVSPHTQLPLIDVASDTGKFVAAILAEPEKFEGRTVSGAAQLTTYAETAKELSRVLGKTVTYNRIPEIEMRRLMPPATADMLIGMLMYYQDFGYYGPQTKDVVQEAVRTARGKLTTFEEYLSKNIPPTLK